MSAQYGKKCFHILLICYTFVFVLCSEGDLSPFYQSCVGRCIDRNCTRAGVQSATVQTVPPILSHLTQWSCPDECQYSCMWTTVYAFQGRGWPVPQFYGKWPFVRIFGLQEAASVIFSAFNFLSQLVVLRQFCRTLGPDYPYFWTWVIYSVICLNSWIWSMIFHARDTPFTEMMDYLSAFSVVIYFLFCFGTRVLGNFMSGVTLIHACVCTILYLHHVTYLLYIKFDYGYNMMVNISVGVFTSLAWLLWCWWYRYQLPYVRHLIQFLLFMGATMALEILDFPPLFWSFDAHALWHLSTVPLPFILFRFVSEDCKHLKLNAPKKSQ